MRNEIEIKYTEKAIENACRHGNINVLNWWYNMKDDIEQV